MVAYSFKKRFAEPILAGTKRQTIRSHRKRHARPGEVIQLYTGMRTPYCKLQGRAICIGVYPVSIGVGLERIGVVMVDGGILEDLDEFARSDGFRDAVDMHKFWITEHGHGLFDGVLVRWSRLLEDGL